MRYRIGEPPEQQLMLQFDGGVFVMAAVLGLVFGIILTGLGIKGRQLWLRVWGSGLVLASIVFIAAAVGGVI